MSKPSKIDYIIFNNQVKCPMLGLGTYLMNGEDCYQAVKEAIRIGYRHIDTASYYKNEDEVGRAVNDSIKEFKIKREDLFVVTKLPSSCNIPSLVVPALKKSLSLMNLSYVDLYLVHTPISKVPKYDSEPTLENKTDKDGNILFNDMKVSEVWVEMEKCSKLGLAKCIGVSNFNSEQIKEIVANCDIKPVTNQVEVHPYLQQHKLRNFCEGLGIYLTAYRPLGGPKPKPGKTPVLKDPIIAQISEKHMKSPVQILLRWHIELKTQLVIAKTSNFEHIAANTDIFDFDLDEEDMLQLKSIDCGIRYCSFDDNKGSKQYPFHIEY